MTSIDKPARRSMPLSKKLLLWTRTLHIYLSVFALLLLLFFASTGFMMNHSEWFNVDGQTTTTIETIIPDEVVHAKPDERALAIVEFLRAKQGAKGEVEKPGINDDPMIVSFKGPHYTFDASIESNGHATITKTTNSLGGFLGNLHKGSDTGSPWKRVVDTTSILLATVSLTGLILWLSLAKRRTLGIIALAVCIVVVLGVFFFFVP